MTNDEIRIKIAESLGWDFNPTDIADWKSRNCWCKSPCGELVFQHNTPNYPEDLNACAELEKTFADDDEFCEKYWLALYDVTQNTRWPYDATPLQRCLAYLKTKGLIP